MQGESASGSLYLIRREILQNSIFIDLLPGGFSVRLVRSSSQKRPEVITTFRQTLSQTIIALIFFLRVSSFSIRMEDLDEGERGE